MYGTADDGTDWSRLSGMAALRRGDRLLSHRVARWQSPVTREVLPAVESAAERTKLWWAAAGIMAAVGGGRQRKAAVAGLAAMGLAELLSNGVGKQLYERRRPPAELIPHDGVHDRPDSSSFPSGHTAAAVGFTAGVAAVSPVVGALCAVPAAVVAVERVQSGAHYPSDVAAGAVLGMASAWLIHRAPKLWWRRLL
ncbi:phosphatase PAP2 family protein [Streptomyces sp. NPDC060198]|uniref:phosphatase PAP2 family protein n=1 Tax=Streptomyces sp. NPDC060198 TaxID=3347070 RepID=UPI00365125B4